MGVSPHIGSENFHIIRRDKSGYFAFFVFQVTKNQSFSGAGHYTGWLQSNLDSMQTPVAFIRNPFLRVEISHLIGTCQYAHFAADAQMRIDFNNTVFPFEGGFNWAHRHAMRFLTIITKHR